MEQTLGHATHYSNLRAAVDADQRVRASWYPIEFPPTDLIENLPPFRTNWSARAAYRAWRLLCHEQGSSRPDVLFFHTQVTALMSGRLMRKIPSVISLDATPMNFDRVGEGYGHAANRRPVERVKRSLQNVSFRSARAFVTWCDWAQASLVNDYGMETSRISVIPPGVCLDVWPAAAAQVAGTPTRLLFVGGDFRRKGGEILLAAFRNLKQPCELHIVTRSAVEGGPGVVVHPDVIPNSPSLKRLYASADIFVLPTLADCFPVVIQEAMAAGLPVIGTDVGAVHEAVRHGETGFLVPPGDARALREAIDCLAADAVRRSAMGRCSRELAERRYDCRVNAERIIDLLLDLGHKQRQ